MQGNAESEHSAKIFAGDNLFGCSKKKKKKIYLGVCGYTHTYTCICLCLCAKTETFLFIFKSFFTLERLNDWIN